MVIVDFASACICVSLCMYHYCGYATVGFMVRQSFFFDYKFKNQFTIIFFSYEYLQNSFILSCNINILRANQLIFTVILNR